VKAADVTVVIPSRNGVSRGFIGSCLASVRAQTRPARRVMVVIDNGTTDGTAQYLRAAWPEVEVLINPGRGLSSARNCAIQRTDTEFIALLDDDDEFLPEKLARLAGYMEAHGDAGMVFTPVTLIDPDGRARGISASSRVGLTYPESLLGNDFMPPSAAVIRRRSLLDAGLFEEACGLCEDYELFIRLSRTCRIAYVDECLTRYRQHPGQMSQAPRQLEQAALAVVTAHARRELPARADAIIGFYQRGAAVRSVIRGDLAYATEMLRAARTQAPTAFALELLELVLRAIGVLLRPLPAIKVPWRRWEQRRVLTDYRGSSRTPSPDRSEARWSDRPSGTG
jgi:glycosyltransferase involved in cell wall biosynthesis